MPNPHMADPLTNPAGSPEKESAPQCHAAFHGICSPIHQSGTELRFLYGCKFPPTLRKGVRSHRKPPTDMPVLIPLKHVFPDKEPVHGRFWPCSKSAVYSKK